MSEFNREFWAPYIALVGPENFIVDDMIIKSPHYCGMDFRRALHGEKYAQPQLEQLMEKYRVYHEILGKSTLSFDDVKLVFYGLIAEPFFDTELVKLIDMGNCEINDEEWWDLVVSLWVMQEFNSDGDRKQNWTKILTHRDKIESLTAELPDKFIAYRAGSEDGLSWTLDEGTARWFHNRFIAQFGRIPFLKKQFTPNDVMFYTNRRNEQEVVVIPSKYL